ncbi:MAG: nucleoside hydrolase [Neisseriaceae bacterium]|nr:MAG: nucleoside hydrolase [Neisseriaceae bacterium]
MNLIVETDIGHDPDDFFSICYLIAAGVNVRAICISPGDPDQVAIAKLILKQIGLDIPVGISHENRSKLSSGSIHHELLKKYGMKLTENPDGMGCQIIEDTIKKYPDCEFLVIGPATNVGKFLKDKQDICFESVTMQGGFLPYSLYKPFWVCPNFEGKEWMPTFNLNGDRPAGSLFLSSKFKSRRMVGKNICHTILFDKDKLNDINPKCTASLLFKEAAEMYFLKHDSKKFHDPTAACLHLHPEIGLWFKGKTIKNSSGWTTVADYQGDDILADLDEEMLWDFLLNFK